MFSSITRGCASDNSMELSGNRNQLSSTGLTSDAAFKHTSVFDPPLAYDYFSAPNTCPAETSKKIPYQHHLNSSPHNKHVCEIISSYVLKFSPRNQMKNCPSQCSDSYLAKPVQPCPSSSPSSVLPRSDTFFVSEASNLREEVYVHKTCLKKDENVQVSCSSSVYHDSAVVSRNLKNQLLPLSVCGALTCQNKSYRRDQFANDGQERASLNKPTSPLMANKRSKPNYKVRDEQRSDRRMRHGRFFSGNKFSQHPSDCDTGTNGTQKNKTYFESLYDEHLLERLVSSSLRCDEFVQSSTGAMELRQLREVFPDDGEGTKGGKGGAKTSPASVQDSITNPSSVNGENLVNDATTSSVSNSSPVLSSPASSALPVRKPAGEARKSVGEAHKPAVESKIPSADTRKFTSDAAKRLSEAGRKPGTTTYQPAEKLRKTGPHEPNGAKKSPLKLDVAERVRGRSASGRSFTASSELRDGSWRSSFGANKRGDGNSKLSSSLPRFSTTPRVSATASKAFTKDGHSKTIKDEDLVSNRLSRGTTPHRSGGRTATVTPSDAPANKRSVKPLTRFGFHDTSVRSGDSTESVNSILSDANTTVSDSNSNLLEFEDEQQNNVNEEILTNFVISDCNVVHAKNLKNTLSVNSSPLNNSNCEDVLLHCSSSPKSPASISQASSGVTSATKAVTAKLKAQSHVLPLLQSPAVKSQLSSQPGKTEKLASHKNNNVTCVTKNTKTPASYGHNDSNQKVDVSSYLPQPACIQKISQNLSSCPVTFKAITSGSIPKPSSTTPSPVEETAITSHKSLATADSGLGSSTEGEKLKVIDGKTHECSNQIINHPVTSVCRSTEVIAALQSQLKSSDHNTKTSSLNGRVDFVVPASECVQLTPSPDDTMKSSLIDESDKWLREKKNSMGKASKLQTGSLLKPATKLRTIFPKNETSHENPAASGNPSIKNDSSYTSPIVPDTHLSFGIARQKFAEYERSRIVRRSETIEPTTGIHRPRTKLGKSPSDPGWFAPVLYDNKHQGNFSSVNKFSYIRPTSLVKNPILVTPVSNEVVEISKPILKRLEYTEGQTYLSNSSDSAAGERVTNRKNSTEDLLMVSSTVQQGKDSAACDDIECRSSNDLRDIEFSVKLNHKSNAPTVHVLESPILENDRDISNSKLSVLSLDSPSAHSKVDNKVSSPGSETSFEVLDTPSEGLDDQTVCNFVSYQDPRGEGDATQDLRQQMQDLQSHEIGSEVLGSHSSEERALIESCIGNIEPEKDGQLENFANKSENTVTGRAKNGSSSVSSERSTSLHEDDLVSSLERSLLVESLTNTVMSESMEVSASASMTSSITSHDPSYTNDPSTFYSFTAPSFNNVESDSRDADKPDAGKASNSDEMKNFMNNLMNSKLEIVDILNNFTIQHKDQETTTSITQKHANENESTPEKSILLDDDVEGKHSNLSLSKLSPVSYCDEATPVLASTSGNNDQNVTSERTLTVDDDGSATVMCTSNDSASFECATPNLQTKHSHDSYSIGANSSGVDIDQDFLIDDEISDQPDLTFVGGDDACAERSELGYLLENTSLRRSRDFISSRQCTALSRSDFSAERIKSSRTKDTASSTPLDQKGPSDGGREDLMASATSDEGISGDDLDAPSPCHAIRRIGRALSDADDSSCPGPRGRPESVCTLASSLDPDDFMLDFEAEDFANRCTTPSGGVGSNGCLGTPLRGPVLSSGNSSVRSSPHHTGKRSLKHESGKPTRLPVLRSQTEEQAGSPVLMDKALQQQLLCDCRATKTMLLQLRAVLLNADASATPHALDIKEAESNPCDTQMRCNGAQSVGDQATRDALTQQNASSLESLLQQNNDLRRQIIQLQEEMEERDRTVRLLQLQLGQAIPNQTLINGTSSSIKDLGNQRLVRSLGEPGKLLMNNAATQTDRTSRMFGVSSLTRQPSVDDGLGPTVSSEESDCATPSRSRSLSRASCLGASDRNSVNSDDQSGSLTTPSSSTRSSPSCDRFGSSNSPTNKLPISKLTRGKRDVQCASERIAKPTKSFLDKRIDTKGNSSPIKARSESLNEGRNREISCKTFQERKEIFSVAQSPARNANAARSS
ncbi:uncharacterized protein LOC108675896 isoform X1 [Hyalella azteca]|uniref:Uncharacterized protein LOC108675896 isoform X1 n=1 Tax=Hyalella azteca TaxID=294128 RepID=A0A8B7P0E8_HYAAZ|nr:uncharacterized protein LOC108675896 isoform X1 [Hyalella azteca]